MMLIGYTHDVHILLLFAMHAEAQPTIDRLGLVATKGFSGFPCKVYTGQDGIGNKVILTVSGVDPDFGVDMVGTQSAAAICALGIAECKPDVVINAGTAGSFTACDAHIGDVYIVEDYLYHDRRISLSGFDKYGVGGYHVALGSHLTTMFPTAVATTGSSLDITRVERLAMSELAKETPLVKDMESAAIAEVCASMGVPLIALKSVTDMIDGDEITGEEFVRNLQYSSETLQIALARLLDELSIDLVRSISFSRNLPLIEKMVRLNKEHEASV